VNKSILIISPDESGHGGSAINAEKIYNLLIENNYNTALLFINSEKEKKFLNFYFKITKLFKPKSSNKNYYTNNNSKNALIFYLNSTLLYIINFIELFLRKKNISKMIINKLSCDPDIVLSKNYKGVLFSKVVFPRAKIIFFCSGSSLGRYMSNCNLSFNKIKNNKIKITKDYYEYYAINKCNIISYNSELLRDFIEYCYNLDKFNTIIDTSNLEINSLNKQNDSKTYDLIFVCSDFLRKDKNTDLVYKIFTDKRLKSLNKVLIGNNIKNINIPNTKILNSVSRNETLKYINKSKLLICTSFFDANPNVIKECFKLNTNFLISKNCGNFNYYPSKNVMSDIYDKESWVNRIILILEDKNKPDLKIINENDCKQEILNIIHSTSEY
tara:strand:+ start:110 stop:1264 length:1155 start_codon:yes stop_codon:yes gene_type:complete